MQILMPRVCKVKPRGFVTMILRHSDGRIAEIREFDNLVTAAGKAALAARMTTSGPAGVFMPYVGIGSGAAEAFDSDITLATELGTRVAGTITQTGVRYINDATFAAGNGTGTIRECGLFSASTSGTMFSRQSNFSPYVKGASQSLQMLWEVEIA